MTIEEILKNKVHRPWEISKENWKFYQEWNDAVFLHWQVEYDELLHFVHPDLELDLFEGKPWVSLVAFNMENIRPKYLPAFSPISFFPEINIRTYVKYKGKPGVHFLSIEAAKKMSCIVAKSISELPYRHSTMFRTKNCFNSENKLNNDFFKSCYTIGQKIENKEDVDLWLTERYALFQNTEKNINEFEIHHVEWPIFELKLNELDLNYPRFNTLINNKPNRVSYSTGVQVIAWGKRKRKIK